MILAKNISYSYGNNAILKDASFFVAKNTKVGLVGVNGAGKSTLFKLITREELPENGRIDITGQIMLVPQEVKRDDAMDHAQNVREYLDPLYQHQDYEILKLLSKLELSQISLDHNPQHFSGGQKTKLAIARALLAEPDILLPQMPK